MSQPRLQGKVALITGAAGGIGSATAALFEAEGAKLVLTDLDVASLAAFAERGALTLAHDVTDEARWREVVDQALARFGQLDVLVNNAGIAVVGNIEVATLGEWRRTQAVNGDSVFLGCREAVRAMKGRGGSIVNISSVAGLIGDAHRPPIVRAKARFGCSPNPSRCIARAKAMACAAIPCIPRSRAPTWSRASSRRRATPTACARASKPAAPMGRMGEAGEVAKAILYLASDDASFTTGAEIVVDGGLTAQ